MDSYVEVTWLNACLLAIFSFCVASYIMMKPVSFKRMMMFTFILISAAICCWFDYSEFVVGGIALISMFVWFYYQLSCFFFAIAIFYLLSFSQYAFLSGSFHNGIYFVPIRSEIIWSWLSILLLLIILFHNGKLWLSAMCYSHPVKIKVGTKNLKLIGYLDSGNLVSFHHIPVIFLDKRYEETFVDSEVELIMLSTVNGVSVCKVYEAQLKLERGNWQSVYVNVEKQIDEELGASCILNRNLWMVR